jgi:hypothetical protein
MNDIERSQWMDVLDRAAAKLERGEAGSDADWMALVTEGLGLPFLYLPAVQVAVRPRSLANSEEPEGLRAKRCETRSSQDEFGTGFQEYSENSEGLTQRTRRDPFPKRVHRFFVRGLRPCETGRRMEGPSAYGGADFRG